MCLLQDSGCYYHKNPAIVYETRDILAIERDCPNTMMAWPWTMVEATHFEKLMTKWAVIVVVVGPINTLKTGAHQRKLAQGEKLLFKRAAFCPCPSGSFIRSQVDKFTFLYCRGKQKFPRCCCFDRNKVRSTKNKQAFSSAAAAASSSIREVL